MREGNDPQSLTPGVLGGDLTVLVSYVWLGLFKWRRHCSCRIDLIFCLPVARTSQVFSVHPCLSTLTVKSTAEAIKGVH